MSVLYFYLWGGGSVFKKQEQKQKLNQKNQRFCELNCVSSHIPGGNIIKRNFTPKMPLEGNFWL